MKKLSYLLLSLLVLISLVGCTSKPKEEDKIVVKIGVVGEYYEYWQPVIDKMAEEGVEIQLVKFAEYAIPNQALSEGDIDMNAFQHYAYLETEVEEAGYDLSVLGETIIAPLGLYSDKITSISEIKAGDTIAIPSDVTNAGRSLKLLEEAGLIKLDPSVGYLATIRDIVENPLNLDIKEVDASMTASLLPDVAAAIINGGNAITFGLNPSKDAIYLETVDVASNPNANRIINVLVVRTEDLNNELYLQILEYFQSEDVAKAMQDAYGGAFIPAWEN